jgi:hypothetical protein
MVSTYFSIADIKTEVISAENNLLNGIFADFISNGEDAPPNIRLKVHKFADSSSSTNSNHSQNNRILMRRDGFNGYFDIDTLEGELEPFSDEILFELYIRILYSLVLPMNNGLAIHASSLVRNGKAYVFPGKSGAGKTTIAELTPESILLTDEISIIRWLSNDLIAYGSPFHGSIGAPGKNTSSKVEGFYFPVKDKENYIEKLDTKSALEKLLSDIVSFGENHNLVRKMFDIAFEVVSFLPCYDLHFLPEPSFWSCIDDREGKS